MERQITVVKYEDGSFALINSQGNKFNPETDERPSVWALIKLDGKEYYVTMPVTLQMIECDPEAVEQRLIRVAQSYSFTHAPRHGECQADNLTPSP